ncbi:MAG: J domain-containing protein [Acidimicrobiales bacterium]
MTDDPFDALGLEPGASAEEIRTRFRELALVHHPDRGGDAGVMAGLLVAYRAALGASGPDAAPVVPRRGRRGRADARARRERDVASFTIDALPVDAFEGLRLAAASLGDIADEEPPYAVEFLVRGGDALWCRCELFPDAGSTTVAVTVAPAGDEPLVRVDGMRDLLVAEINSLEW